VTDKETDIQTDRQTDRQRDGQNIAHYSVYIMLSRAKNDKNAFYK